MSWARKAAGGAWPTVWPVLAAELGPWVTELPTLDLLFEAQKGLGRRISLDALAQATLGASKLGSGLDALEYYRAGDWERLERYCLEDVKLTRDLYEYARKYGQLFFQKGPRRAPVPMSFAEHPLAPLFREVARERASMQLRYGGFSPFLRRLPRTIGHLGITGVHLFLDPERDVTLAMNMHSDREMIRGFRLHIELMRTVVKALREV